jgi:hypothetical protein
MSFAGNISSDFLKLVNIPVEKRETYINYTSTDFLSLRNSLIEYAKAVYPLDYNYFVESDFGMMLIELVAYMGSVLSMKADMLANENFLATAKQRASVKKLLELIGVRMRGPISAAADVKIDFNRETAWPGGDAQEITIPPTARTITTFSPQDSSVLTFTLYKIVNGLIQELESPTSNIVLYGSEGQGTNKDVFTNLVMQEGALVEETGSFLSTEGVKSVVLSQFPVVEGSVQVYVTSQNSNSTGAYKEVDSVYFSSGVSDKIFEIVYNDDYAATVVFGDGNAGISPESSADYFITYRVGGGTRGNISKEAINISVISEEEYEGTLTNISVATGGQDAETISHAKKYAPLTFRRQDRLVTLEDYSVFANTYISSFGTIGKATAATRKSYASANIIDIYILEKASDLQLRKATPVFKTNLLEAINKKKMATDEVVIVDGLIRTLDLVVTINIDLEQKENQASIVGKARNAILDFFNPNNMDFGESLNVADLNRKIFEIDEIRFSTLDNVSQDIKVDFNEIIQLNNLTINVNLLK